MKILILTPIEIEYTEVKKHLQIPSNPDVPSSGIQYELGKFKGRFHEFEIIITQTGSKNTDIALAAEKAIQKFNPAIVILTGIAGGVKDVKIGDIVIANKLYGYEAGKETDDGFVSRPEVFNCSLDLVDHAKKIGRSDQWKSRSDFAENSKVYTGPIISGDKVIASTDSVVYQRLKRHFNDTLALEMEASGFGKVMLYYPSIKFINIRGVSDLLKGKSETDGEGGQELAVANVSAFVFETLSELDYQTLNIGGVIDSKSVISNANAQPTKEVVDSTIERMHKLITKNKIKPVLELLLPISKIYDEDLHRNCLLLANRWNRLMNEKMSDLIAKDQYNIELNRILKTLTFYLDEL